jgi:hypothetical protein
VVTLLQKFACAGSASVIRHSNKLETSSLIDAIPLWYFAAVACRRYGRSDIQGITLQERPRWVN